MEVIELFMIFVGSISAGFAANAPAGAATFFITLVIWNRLSAGRTQ